MRKNLQHLIKEKRVLGILLIYVTLGFTLKAQVKLGDGSPTPHIQALLDLEASDKGLLLPRVSTATRSSTLANAPAGLVVYDTDLNRLMIKQGPDAASWAALSMSATLPDTLKGLVGIYNSGLVGNNRSPVLRVTNGSTGIQGNRLADFTRPIATAGGKSVLLLGKDSTSKNGAWIGYTHAGNNNNNNALSFGFTDREDIVSINGYGNVRFTNTQFNQLGHADENNRYSTTSFYHWNKADIVGIGAEYAQTLRIGQYQGSNKSSDKYADIFMSLYTPSDNSNSWVHKVEHSLSGKPWFLRYDSNENLILGKGDQVLRSMYLYATGTLNKGLVSMGHRNPDASAVLDLNYQGPSNDLGRGLLLPRYSTATLNNANFYQPATGLLAYDQTLNRVVMNAGTPAARNWQPLLTASDTLSLSNRINQRLGAGLNASTIVGDTLKTRLAYISGQSVSNNDTPILSVSNTATGIQGNRLADFTRPIATAGGKSVLLLGKDANNKNAAWFSYTHAGDNNNNNQLSIGFPGREDVFSINAKGAATFLDSKDNSFWSSERDDRISITNFYHWNTSDEIGVNNNYGQKLRLGALMGPDKNTAIAQANHYVDLDMFLTTYNVPQDTWVNNFGIKLKDSYYFLKYGSDQKLILGKGDQANKTMLIHATGYTRLGVVSIGHQNPDVSALLDLNFAGTSDDLGKGLLLPRYSTATLNNANFYQPATGLLAFDQTKGRVVMNAGTPAARNWQTLLLPSDTLSLGNRLNNLSSGSFKGFTDWDFTKYGVSNSATGTAKLYSYNNTDAAVQGTTFSQSLEIGHRGGRQQNGNLRELNVEIKFSTIAASGTYAPIGYMPYWYQKAEFTLKDKPTFLSFDSDRKLILGKGDEANKTMLINAANTSRVGIVSIGHQSPDVSALLDLNFSGTSDDLGKGLLLPRYSTATLNNANFYQPAAGLLAYDQTLNRVVMNAGTPASRDWQPMVLGNAGSVTLTGLSTNVSNPNVKANSIIILTAQDGGTASFSVSNKAAGSFTINTSADGSSKTVGYLIIN